LAALTRIEAQAQGIHGIKALALIDKKDTELEEARKDHNASGVQCSPLNYQTVSWSG